MSGNATAPQTDSTGAVEAYVRALFDGCAAALSTLLSRSVSIEADPALRAPTEPIATVLPPPWFVYEARFTRGVAGAHDILLPDEDALALARLVLGEESSDNGVVSSDHEDALKEMLNQMLSSASSALKVFLGRPTALSLGDLRHIESPEGWTPHGATVATARLFVDGVPRARLALTVPTSVRDEVAAARDAAGTAAARDASGGGPAGLEMILDISMTITVELGRTRMLIRDILSLGPGSVVELDKLAGEPVDLLVNDRPIAKGEVVVIDENFGVRLTQISQPVERIRSMS